MRTRAIEAVLANYQLLLDALEEIQQGKDEYALKANGFLHSILKFSTFFGLKVSQLIFSAIEQLSVALQGKDTTIQDAVQALKYSWRDREVTVHLNPSIVVWWMNQQISLIILHFPANIDHPNG